MSRNFTQTGRPGGTGIRRSANFPAGGTKFARGGNFNRSGNGNGSYSGNWNGKNRGGRGYRGYAVYGRGYGGYGGYGGFGFFPWYWFLPGFASGYGLGYGFGWGYGGYGYPYYSYGYPYYNYGYPYAYGYSGYYANATPVTPAPSASGLTTGTSVDYIAEGEAGFQAGQYGTALRDWQHAMVDNPDNGAVVLLMSQALFQMGQYEAAAGMVQSGMAMLPEDEWSNVVKNYRELYGNIGSYTNQLRALEKARKEKPDDPALRFLLGYHYGYLGYPKQAVKELDKALDLQPDDLGSEKLRDIFAAAAGLPARPHAAHDKLPATEGALPVPPPPAATPGPAASPAASAESSSAETDASSAQEETTP